jgi:hypothetical protein
MVLVLFIKKVAPPCVSYPHHTSTRRRRAKREMPVFKRRLWCILQTLIVHIRAHLSLFSSFFLLVLRHSQFSSSCMHRCGCPSRRVPAPSSPRISAAGSKRVSSIFPFAFPRIHHSAHFLSSPRNDDACGSLKYN